MKVLYDLDRDKWNSFVSSFEEPAILQSYEWGELKSKHGWRPIRIAIEENGNICGAISLLEKKIPKINASLFYAPRGPILDYSNKEAFDLLLRTVKEEAKKKNAIELKIDPQIEEGSDSLKTIESKGFLRINQNIQPRTTFIIDLERSTDDILKSFDEKTRYNIRLSLKKGVVVKEVSSDSGVDTFYEIYKETAKRDNFLIHPVSYYKNIKKYLVDRGMANIFIAYHESNPVAGVFTFNYGSRIWYMYGASTNASRNVMPNHALHWFVIGFAKEKGLKSYDLFGIPSNPDKNHPLWGVYRFKKGFNGKLVKYAGVYDLPYNKLFYFAFEKGMRIYKNLRSLILKGKISDSLQE